MTCLEMYFRIDGLRSGLYVDDAVWGSARFTQDEDGRGFLDIASEPLDGPGELDEARVRLWRLARQFVSALEFEYGKRLLLEVARPERVPDWKDQPSHVSLIATVQIRAFLDAEIIYAPRPVPESMPSVPLEAERWIRTYSEASDFDDYPEERIKRYYLIIEELQGGIPDIFPLVQQEVAKQQCERMRNVRDFVSHPKCDNRYVVDFVISSLPGACVELGRSAYVMYDRTKVEHRNFVAEEEGRAREFVRDFIRRKLDQLANA